MIYFGALLAVSFLSTNAEVIVRRTHSELFVEEIPTLIEYQISNNLPWKNYIELKDQFSEQFYFSVLD